MALFDVFKKKEEGRKDIKPKIVKKAVTKSVKPKVVKSIKKPVIQKEKKIELAYRILKTPHVTEKATALVEKNQYVFNVYNRANKIEVKKSVKDIYGVDVVGVRIINIHPKKRRLGKIEGVKKGYKKAIVKIKKGQKIEVLPR